MSRSNGHITSRVRARRGPNRAVLAGTAVVAALALAACGNSGSTTTAAGPTSNVTVIVQKDATIAAELPDAIKKAGVITAAIDAGFPVNNYFDTDGKTIIGLSPDLLKAVGQVLGVRIDIREAKLATIIPALQAARFDMAGMVLTDSTAREKVIDLVDFQQAGQQFLVRQGNPDHITQLADACGRKVAVAQGGTPVELLQKQSTACTSSGKAAVNIQQFADVNQALLAVQNNRADATISDLTKTGYEATNSKGILERAGNPFAPTPAGWGVPKSDPQLTKALTDATDLLIKNGQYAKIFDKWQLSQAVLPQVVVNRAGNTSS